MYHIIFVSFFPFFSCCFMDNELQNKKVMISCLISWLNVRFIMLTSAISLAERAVGKIHERKSVFKRLQLQRCIFSSHKIQLHRSTKMGPLGHQEPKQCFSFYLKCKKMMFSLLNQQKTVQKREILNLHFVTK